MTILNDRVVSPEQKIVIHNILGRIYPKDKQHLNLDIEVIKYCTDMMVGRGLITDRVLIYGEVASIILKDDYEEDKH